MQRSTEMPRGDKVPSSTRMVSKIPADTTKQSKRLKSDMKYWRRPSAYIFSSISATKRASSTRLALSGVQDPAHQSMDLLISPWHSSKGRRAVLLTSLLCPLRAAAAANALLQGVHRKMRRVMCNCVLVCVRVWLYCACSACMCTGLCVCVHVAELCTCAQSCTSCVCVCLHVCGCR